jgi:hypothetical protein
MGAAYLVVRAVNKPTYTKLSGREVNASFNICHSKFINMIPGFANILMNVLCKCSKLWYPALKSIAAKYILSQDV